VKRVSVRAVKPKPPLPPLEEWPEHMLIAKGELGIRELPGPGMHRRIAQYYAATTVGKPINDDVPWCASFVSWVLQQAAMPSTRRANARSYLAWGEPVMTPEFGDVVVLWRGDPRSASGHVGFYAGHLDSERIWLLSGNQNNSVCYSPYELRRLVGYRRSLDAGKQPNV
jgi:uncharacterized protein (TIGR02594 family)